MSGDADSPNAQRYSISERVLPLSSIGQQLLSNLSLSPQCNSGSLAFTLQQRPLPTGPVPRWSLAKVMAQGRLFALESD